MKKVSLKQQLKDSEEAAAKLTATFQDQWNRATLIDSERIRHINELTSHNKVQSYRIVKQDEIYKRTMKLAERLALEKDTLSNANAKLVFMLDEVRIGYNALSEAYKKLAATR